MKTSKPTRGVGPFAKAAVPVQAAVKPTAVKTAPGRIGNLGAFAHAPKKKSSKSR
jgi:hypothetical protein